MTDMSTLYQYFAYIGVVMNHSFDVDIAVKYGMLEAVMINNFAYWISKNMANEKHFHDGKYWTYNTVSAFEELFPYASKKQIRNALEHLRAEGLIETGNYNEKAFDRTLWYTFTPKGFSIFLAGRKDLPTWANGDAPQGKPIPNINTDVNTNNKPNSNNSFTNGEQAYSFADEFEYVWNMYPRKQGKQNAFKAYEKARRAGTPQQEIIDGLNAYLNYIKIERVSPKYIAMGSTWFNQNRWKDDYTVHREPTTKDLADQFDYSDW